MSDTQKENKAYTTSEIIKLHLEKFISEPEKQSSNELEVRFGTRNIHRISKIDTEKVIQVLKSMNFVSLNETGDHTLNIQTEYTDLNTGRTKLSNLRTSIEGFSNIQDYCKTNVLKNTSENVSHMLKSYVKVDENTIYPINVDEFNLRISYQNEKKLNKNSPMIKSLVANWGDTKKTFRLINRVSYTHPSYPFRVDISVVKMSIKNKRGGMIPVYKIEDSNLFSSQEIYEIELELDNKLITSYYARPTPEELEKSMKQMIKIIMSGLQNSKYPITYPEQKNVIEEYLKIIHGEKHDIKFASPKHFCGPSS